MFAQNLNAITTVKNITLFNYVLFIYFENNCLISLSMTEAAEKIIKYNANIYAP